MQSFICSMYEILMDAGKLDPTISLCNSLPSADFIIDDITDDDVGTSFIVCSVLTHVSSSSISFVDTASCLFS